ncbi:MAG: DUF2334 domain-containing protein, partial [Lachnospiraceae bacterium]|nr:DUF2334 domain-containing protein [Lachnospiraceae bacterium]
LLDQYQVKPLIGVVPDNRDENLVRKESRGPEDFWAYIKELEKEGWVMAMHGFRHIYTTDRGGIFPLNNFSEFAGVPYERQREMLAAGKGMLEEKGIQTDIFMAPAHSYDGNTLKALKDTGFWALTDGFGDYPYRFQGLTFFPISFQLGRTFKKKKGYSTMVVHTGTVSEKDLERYKGYFENKNVQWISYKEYLSQPPEERHFPGRWKEFLMAKGKYLLVKLRQ